MVRRVVKGALQHAYNYAVDKGSKRSTDPALCLQIQQSAANNKDLMHPTGAKY